MKKTVFWFFSSFLFKWNLFTVFNDSYSHFFTIFKHFVKTTKVVFRVKLEMID